MSNQLNRPANNRRTAAKALLPKGAADHRHLVVGGVQRAAEDGTNTQRFVEIARNPNAADWFAAAIGREFHRRVAESCYRLEALGLVAQELEIGKWGVAGAT